MNKPSKPIESYETAELPSLPQIDAEASPVPAPPEPEIAVLDFINPEAITVSHTLNHPFRYEGQVITAIIGRRLSVAEVGKVADRMMDAGYFDRYEFYAAMTGFPASVIRGLIDEDGGALIGKLIPLLPPVARPVQTMPAEPVPAPSPSTMLSGNGDDMPLPPVDP